MTTGIAPLTARPAWKALQAHHDKVRDLHLRTLFALDPKRGERLTAEDERAKLRTIVDTAQAVWA